MLLIASSIIRIMGNEIDSLLSQKLSNPFFRQFPKQQVQQYVTRLMNLRKSINPTPAAKSIESYFLGKDHTKIFYQLWPPKKGIERILIMSHGFQCHSDLYYVLGDYFFDKNILVAAWDQRGHGRSYGTPGALSSFALVNDDLYQFIQLLKRLYPKIPIYLMGESMGALVILNFATRYPGLTSGLITLVPGIRPKLLIFKILQPLRPFTYILKTLLNKKPIIKIPSDFENPTYLDAFNDYDMHDLLHLNLVSLGLLYNLVNLIANSLKQSQHIVDPILICQGTGDKALDVQGAIELHHCIHTSDKQLKLYHRANHSLLMDKFAQNIYADIYAWINQH